MIELSEEHTLLQETIRRFAQDTVLPRAHAMDDHGELDSSVLDGMRELGLFGLTLPEAAGGVGMDALALVIAIQELARADGATAWTLLAHLALGAMPIATLGQPSLVARVGGKLASGEALATAAISEPDAGSDMLAAATTVEQTGSGFILRGRKLPVTNASKAGAFLVSAHLGANGPLTLFCVERECGVKVGRRISTLGLRAADVAEISFDGITLPADAQVGADGAALELIAHNRVLSRLGVAAFALGLAENALERATKYSQERVTFGKPIAKHQAITLKLADMQLLVETSRNWVMRAAGSVVAGKHAERDAAFAKTYCSEAAVKVAYDAIQIHGGYGYSAEYEVERLWRDAKYATLAEGSNELVRLELAS